MWQYLFGDAEGALHAAGRLGLDGQVGWPPAAPHGAPTPMEQRHLHPRVLAHLCGGDHVLKMPALFPEGSCI